MTRLALAALCLSAAASAQTSPPMPPPAPAPVGTAPPAPAPVGTAAAVAPSPAESAARFLAEVAARPGVQRSRSGVLWTVERAGSGQRPTRGEAGLVEYVGSLADGTVFDRSPAGAPVRLPVRGVVPGMAEALQEMRPGETRTVYLPPSLAYGARGVAGRGGVWRVPPHAALVFRLTLVRVVP